MAPDRRPSSDFDVDWFTISYRTIYRVAAAVVLVAAIVGGLLWYRSRPAPPEAAPEPSAATTARFTAIQGGVKVKSAGSYEWIAADSSLVLRKSDLVRTGANATAEITFFDGTVVHVRPDSLITIEETSEDPSTKRRRVAWHIASGDVNYATSRASAAGSTFEVSTPTLRITAAEQTDGGIRVDESGESDVRVFHGTVSGQTKMGQAIALGASEATRVDSAGRAGPKVLMPSAPVLLAPQHQTEVSYVDPSRATTLLVWKAVPGAASYHVVVDYSPQFNRPLVDRRQITDTQVELRGLEAGKYYWRVASTDRGGLTGSFSEHALFAVVQPGGPTRRQGPPPALAIDTLEVRGNILQIKGRTEPGARVTVNAQNVDVQLDGSFNELIELETTARQVVVVRAVGKDGGVNEQRRPVVVGF